MSEPLHLGGEAARLLGASGDRRALRASAVLLAWHTVAGEDVSRHTLGGRFSDGELAVFVDSAVWANELQLMGETFRASLNERLRESGEPGKETVTRLRFTVSRRVEAARREAAERERADRRYRRRGQGEALTDDERERVRRAAEGLAEGDLRAAFERAMGAEKRRRKGGP